MFRTVVKVTVGKSQALYSSVTRRSKDKNSGLLTVGAIAVDIPQHPVALHGMMTRGSKQLSSTLQVITYLVHYICCEKLNNNLLIYYKYKHII